MNPKDQLVFVVACAWLTVLVLFALPSIIAFWQRAANRWLVLAINASVAGWAVAMLLAVYPLLRLGRLTGADRSGAGCQAADEPFPLLVASLVSGARATSFARSSAAASITELERLAQLRADGHLSESEFAVAKRQVLERL
ncbi:SHOCT domain-containing protein [Methylobacterium sp. A49B]